MSMSEYLNKLKDEHGLTQNQISELSGISLSTVNRIFSGQAESANLSTLADIVKAMGGSFDEMLEINAPMSEKPSQEKNVNRESVESVYMRRLIEIYTKSLKDKNRWITLLFALLFIIIGAILGVVIYDFSNLDIGYIRSTASQALMLFPL